MKKSLARIFVPGGILSPGELRRIANSAHYAGAEHLHLGDRQGILFSFEDTYEGELKKRLEGGQYQFELGKQTHHNIMTSFLASNVFNSTTWLTEGIYLEILSNFNHSPGLRINITDPLQSLVPMFSGDLNYIASPHDNYWYLFIRFPGKDTLDVWPVLVDGSEIARLSETIEKIFLTKRNINLVQLETYVYNSHTWSFRIMEAAFSHSYVRFPNYEGFHPMGERYWLGLYQRNNLFPINFIDNLCILCSETNIGNINITPWGSFLIKNIDEKHIEMWERLLGKHGINTGHSQLELNWQLPELDKKALKVKHYVNQLFEKKGLRTEGLIFGITSESENIYASILIRKKSFLSFGNYDLFTSYEVKYKQGFDPHSSRLISFAGGLKRRNLPNVLTYLCGLYYDGLNRFTSSALKEKPALNYEKTPAPAAKDKKVYQCSACLTVYDPAFGDELSGVMPGTAFNDLPETYKCSLCESPKESFVKISAEKLAVVA